MDSEEDKCNEDFQDTLGGPASEAVITMNGGEEADSVSAGRLGGDTWQLFGQTGVRMDSL
jgi:hypothetical protein